MSRGQGTEDGPDGEMDYGTDHISTQEAEQGWEGPGLHLL